MKLPRTYIWILSGFLLGISFVFSFLWWCFLPAFVLFLYAIGKETSLTRIFFFGWLIGTLQYAGAFFWVWSAFPILWMPEAPLHLQFAAIGYYYVITSVAVGLGGAIAFLAIKKLSSSHAALILLVPPVWVLSEVLKSLLFSVYSFGDGSFLSASFSYGYIGYLLAEHPVTLQLASVAGVYGLSLFAALLGVLGFLFIARRLYTKKLPLLACIALCAVGVFGYFVEFPDREYTGKVVISLESYFTPEYLSKEGAGKRKDAEVKEAMALALQEGADVIATPEDVRWSDAFGSTQELFSWMKEHTDSKSTVIVDSGPSVDARLKPVIRAYMYDLSTESVYFFDKKYLVPQGEFLSYVHEAALKLLMDPKKGKEISHFARFKAGVIGDSSLLPQHLPGILFCFETMVPYAVRKAASFRDPDLIVHPISHSWFTDPFSLEYQLRSMLKVHAVWNRIPIVTSGTMTKNLMYLPSGEVKEGEVIYTSEHLVLKRFSP